MGSENLANLAKIGKLKAERPVQKEFDGLLQSGRTRLKDALGNWGQSQIISAKMACWAMTGASFEIASRDLKIKTGYDYPRIVPIALLSAVV